MQTVEKMCERERREAIAKDNDRFRESLGRCAGAIKGKWVLTPGVVDQGPAFLAAATRAVAEYSDWSEDNNPHGERDFGAFEIEGQKVFFKVDYYDPTLSFGSPDPLDLDQTHRVLTVMLAHEY